MVPDDPPEALTEYHIITMADETAPHISLKVPQSRTRRQSATSSAHSSSTEDNSTSSNPSRRRQTSSAIDVSLHPGASSDPARRRRRIKSTSSGSREGPHQGTTITMPGMAASAGEITYTPTTHRISKAKKGKKVHACEHPGCTKVWALDLGPHSSC